MIVQQRPNGFRLFFAMRGSILPRIAPHLAACTGLAVAVWLTHGYLFDWKMTLTAVPFSLIGLALAIFLGFRNSAAYDRYWEARKLWGDLVHRSRSLARQACTLISPAEAEWADRQDYARSMTTRAIAYAHALRHQLRGSDAAADIAAWLPADEAAAVGASRNPPDALVRRHAADLQAALRSGRIHPALGAEIDETLSGIAAVASGCERIKTTPIPFVYTLLLHRTAYLYCFLLPFGLIDSIGVMTPFVVAIVAYTFFGLDAVGDEIEEPFGLGDHHLPLNALCRTIEISLLEAIGESRIPPPLEAVDGFLR